LKDFVFPVRNWTAAVGHPQRSVRRKHVDEGRAHPSRRPNETLVHDLNRFDELFGGQRFVDATFAPKTNAFKITSMSAPVTRMRTSGRADVSWTMRS
jgi:hypothetical protein